MNAQFEYGTLWSSIVRNGQHINDHYLLDFGGVCCLLFAVSVTEMLVYEQRMFLARIKTTKKKTIKKRKFNT